MPGPEPMRKLILGIAGLYEREGRPGGAEVCATLRNLARDLPDLPRAPAPPMADQLAQAIALSPHPLSADIADALPWIVWQHAGLEDGRIRSEVAARMLTAEIVGPTGMFHSGTVCAGLFLQGRDVDYTTRSHAAEETWVTLTSTGRWSLDHAQPAPRAAGEMIFHPSWAPHATFTDAEPLLAVWRWSGEIGWDTYRMAGVSPDRG